MPAGVKRARVAEVDVAVRIHPKDRDEFSFEDSDDDTLGHQGDCECTRNFTGDILVAGRKAGSFSANLIDRRRAGNAFHTACDAESCELQEFGCLLFSSRGAPRHLALKRDSSVERGGYLYIGRFHVNPEHRVDGETDIGTAAIRALLSCPQLSGRWTVASYIADSKAVQTVAEAAADGNRDAARVRGGPAETVEEQSRSRAGSNERMAKDARQFLRAGFAELAYEQGGWLYMTKGMMRSPPMTHAEALSMPLRLTSAASAAGAASFSASRVGLTEADRQLLLELMQNSSATTVAMLAVVDRFLAQGADLTRAGVLQFSVVHGKKELLEPLLSRGAQISGKDGQSGLTALMIAAEGVPGNVSRDRQQHDSSTVSSLLAVGADKNVVDDDGCSALGYYLRAIRRSNDMNATFDLHEVGLAKQTADPLLVRMLTPDRGPTCADKQCADDHDHPA